MPQILVIAEHADGHLKLATGSAAGFAHKVCAESGSAFDILLLGSGIDAVADAASHYGAANLLVADSPVLEQPLADKYAQVIAEVAHQRGVALVVAAASTFSKDILPRAAALLDAGMLGDVIDVQATKDDFVFRRVMYAGNVIATARLAGEVKFLTVRSSAFDAPEKTETPSPISAVGFDFSALPSLIEFVGREQKSGGRPDSTEARVVVSGGRALKNAEDFERLVGGLADALGGAVGSSRALVDAGITPNSLQIGQTGKIVAPELYVAVGISGAIQHMAGMKDTKVIAAINKDPEAPIFEVADYGLVADVYEAVPELIAKIKGNC
jgi:electron transfer flavoprotein alpha subunit